MNGNAVEQNNNKLNLDYLDYPKIFNKKNYYRAFIKMSEDSFKQRMYKNEMKLLKAINENFENSEKCNMFISMNTFFKPRRITENIAQLENLYVDLDYYKTRYSVHDILSYIYNNEDIIPLPSLIMSSGQGLYLIWHIKPCPLKALALWTALERYFCEVLKDFGADLKATDASRFLRIPGSLNLKNNKKVEILEKFNTKYTLNELKDLYFKISNKTSKKQKKTVTKVTHLFNTYSLHFERTRDLIKLCELREYNMTGYREIILFLYRYYMNIILDDEKQALNNTLDLNNKFKDKLTEIEVERATKSANKSYKDKKYKYTNKKLIELLDITNDEMKSLKTIISKEIKYNRNNENRSLKRRNEQGLTKKQVEILELKQKIKTLREQGFTQVAISKQLKKSIRTIKNYS